MGGGVKRGREGEKKGKSNIEKFASLFGKNLLILWGGINGIKIAILSRVLRKEITIDIYGLNSVGRKQIFPS